MSAVMLLLCYLPNPNDHDYYNISRCIIEYVQSHNSHCFITSSEKCDARLSSRTPTFPSRRRQFGTDSDVNKSVKQTLSNQPELINISHR